MTKFLILISEIFIYKSISELRGEENIWALESSPQEPEIISWIGRASLQGLRFRVQGTGYRVYPVQGTGYWVLGNFNIYNNSKVIYSSINSTSGSHLWKFVIFLSFKLPRQAYYTASSRYILYPINGYPQFPLKVYFITSTKSLPYNFH